MIQYNGLTNFNAYSQYVDDYRNLACFHHDFNLFKAKTAEKDKAYHACKKYLNRIIENCKVLGFDFQEEERMLNDMDLNKLQ